MKRVLIIDDEDDIREVAQVSLETVEGWEVITASSGQKGLDIAAASPPDVILLDVMMPDMDGPTTFKRLRENPLTARIPVMFLTAKAQTQDRERFEQLGVNGVLFKPFDPLTLGEQMRQVLGWAAG